jgi:hypothetical protein
MNCDLQWDGSARDWTEDNYDKCQINAITDPSLTLPLSKKSKAIPVTGRGGL